MSQVVLEALVDDGLLNLPGVFRRAAWRDVGCIATRTAWNAGQSYPQPIVLQEARCYGMTAYRWAEAPWGNVGPVTLDRDGAVEQGLLAAA